MMSPIIQGEGTPDLEWPSHGILVATKAFSEYIRLAYQSWDRNNPGYRTQLKNRAWDLHAALSTAPLFSEDGKNRIILPMDEFGWVTIEDVLKFLNDERQGNKVYIRTEEYRKGDLLLLLQALCEKDEDPYPMLQFRIVENNSSEEVVGDYMNILDCCQNPGRGILTSIRVPGFMTRKAEVTVKKDGTPRPNPIYIVPITGDYMKLTIDMVREYWDVNKIDGVTDAAIARGASPATPMKHSSSGIRFDIPKYVLHATKSRLLPSILSLGIVSGGHKLASVISNHSPGRYKDCQISGEIHFHRAKKKIVLDKSGTPVPANAAFPGYTFVAKKNMVNYDFPGEGGFG